jgi:uncharacterized membrane protein YbaN (DUF454 family)
MIRTFHRGLWLTAGLFFTLLGIIGLMLPVVPQLPFLLAALVCFMRCSARLTGWVEGKPWFIRMRARFRKIRHS